LFSVNFELFSVRFDSFSVSFDLLSISYDLFSDGYDLHSVRYAFFSTRFDFFSMRYDFFSLPVDFFTLHIDIFECNVDHTFVHSTNHTLHLLSKPKPMKPHMGKLVLRVMKERGIRLKDLSAQMQITPPALRQALNWPDMKIHRILKLSELLGEDLLAHLRPEYAQRLAESQAQNQSLQNQILELKDERKLLLKEIEVLHTVINGRKD
jgi:lambda repressor-like predicted transcriptional regulator